MSRQVCEKGQWAGLFWDDCGLYLGCLNALGMIDDKQLVVPLGLDEPGCWKDLYDVRHLSRAAAAAHGRAGRRRRTFVRSSLAHARSSRVVARARRRAAIGRSLWFDRLAGGVVAICSARPCCSPPRGKNEPRPSLRRWDRGVGVSRRRRSVGDRARRNPDRRRPAARRSPSPGALRAHVALFLSNSLSLSVSLSGGTDHLGWLPEDFGEDPNFWQGTFSTGAAFKGYTIKELWKEQRQEDLDLWRHQQAETAARAAAGQ